MSKNKAQIKQIASYLKLLLIILLVSCSRPESTDKVDRILEKFHDANSEYVMVAAHRAAHNEFPENSLPAIKNAIDLGVDIAY